MPIQQQIEGVRDQRVRSEVAPSVHWSADEAAARKAIKAAFEADEKHQWTIGDLLNRIVPSMGQGVKNPEGTAKLEVIAEENVKTVGTLVTYRQVAEIFSADHGRPLFGAARSFVGAFNDEAPAELATYVEQGGKLTEKAVREYLAELTGKGQREAQSTRDFVESLREKINKRFPSTVDEFRLTDEELLELKVLRLAIDNVIGARVQA